MVKNPPSSAGDAGSIPGPGTKIPHAAGQLGPRATTTEPTRPGACAQQLERENPRVTTREKPACCNEEPALQLRPDAAKKKRTRYELIHSPVHDAHKTQIGCTA